MDDIRNDKEVDFAKYCKTCKYGKLPEHEDPCDDCLMHPCNENSHKPVKWEEK